MAFGDLIIIRSLDNHGHKPLPVNLAVKLFMNLWAIIEGMMGVEKDKLRVIRGSE